MAAIVMQTLAVIWTQGRRAKALEIEWKEAAGKLRGKGESEAEQLRVRLARLKARREQAEVSVCLPLHPQYTHA